MKKFSRGVKGMEGGVNEESRRDTENERESTEEEYKKWKRIRR